MAGNELLDDRSYADMQPTSSITTERYDDYLRVTADISEFSYVVLGCFGLVCCVLGVLMNVICIPIFLTNNIRASATTYMLTITIFDTITLLSGASTLVTSAMWPKQIDQVQVYKSVTGYLVPYIQPLMEFTEMMSVYLCAALLIERFKFIRHGIYVRVLCSLVRTNRIIVMLFVFCFVYNIPKVLEFQAETLQVTIVCSVPSTNEQSNAQSAQSRGSEIQSNLSSMCRTASKTQVRVLRTELGNSTTFQEIYDSLLRVPIEMFIPLIVISLFGALIAHSVFTSGMHAAVLSSSPSENKNEFGIEKVTDSDLQQQDSKEKMEMPSRITSESKQFEANTAPSAASASSGDIAEWREQMNTVVSTGIAFLVLGCKLPEFVQHMLISERVRFGIPVITLLRFGAVVNLLAFVNASMKPLVYFVCGAHFREEAKTLFCLCCSRLSKPFGNQATEATFSGISAVRLSNGDEENVPMIVLATEPTSYAPTPTQPNSNYVFSDDRYDADARTAGQTRYQPIV